MAESVERASTKAMDREEQGQDILLKTKPQPELDETFEQLTKHAAKGGGIAFVGNVIGKIATFGLHVLLGRVLGPGIYGLYALGASVTGIARSIGSFGLDQGVVRFCSIYRGGEDNARIKGTILSALVISAIVSVLVTGMLFTFASMIAQNFFHEPGLTWMLRVFALALPFYVLMGVTASFAQSFRRIAYQQGVQNIFRPLVNLGLVGLGFLLGFRVAGAVYGFLASGVLSAGLGFYFLWKLFPEMVSHLKPAFESKKLIRFSVPMFLAGFCYLALHQTDRIMLGHFAASSEVGVYNAASVISQQLPLFLLSVVNIFSPMIADLYNKHQLTKLHYLYKTVSRWIFATSLPLAVIVSIFSLPVMGLFGSEFMDGWLVLVTLTLSQIVWFSVGGAGAVLQMMGKQDLVLIDTATMLLANIGLNFWLIPLWGKLGAAIATAVSISAVEIAVLIQVKRILGMHPFSGDYIKSLIAIIPIVVTGIGVMRLVKGSLFNLVIITTGLVLVYAVFIWLLGLRKEDKQLLLAMLQRVKSCPRSI